MLQVPFRRFPPLVAGATTLPGGKHVTGFAGRLQLPYESSSFATPSSRGHYQAPLCCELLMKGLLFRALFCPRLRGKSGEAGKGEASAASQSAECLSCHMMQKANPVTLTLCSSPVRAIPQPSAPQALSPPERSEHNLPPLGGHNPRGEAPSTFPSEPFEPGPLCGPSAPCISISKRIK